MASLSDSRSAAERTARQSFGRLVAWLAWQWRDVAAAEDALSDALVKALETWPRAGVPDAPGAWMLAVAKRQLLKSARHDRVRNDPGVMEILRDDEEARAPADVPDARLRLMFVCAHPAIDEKMRTPLMLQTVLGLPVEAIASAMLISPSALAQRLVRAKQKIKDAGLRFEEPEARELPERLNYVLESIYAAYGLGSDAIDGAEEKVTGLREEGIYLCSLVCELLPDAPEAMGLLALMTFCDSRRTARFAADGEFVPLALQDVALWNRESIVKADQLLWTASQFRQPGPFQLEAAVQSAHCHRLFTGTTPWHAIAEIYGQINQHFPTQGSRVAGAVALAEAGDVERGCEQLLLMDGTSVKSFQPWWVARAHLSSLAGDTGAAKVQLATAIGLSTQRHIKNYLERRMTVLSAS